MFVMISMLYDLYSSIFSAAFLSMSSKTFAAAEKSLWKQSSLTLSRKG